MVLFIPKGGYEELIVSVKKITPYILSRGVDVQFKTRKTPLLVYYSKHNKEQILYDPFIEKKMNESKILSYMPPQKLYPMIPGTIQLDNLLNNRKLRKCILVIHTQEDILHYYKLVTKLEAEETIPTKYVYINAYEQLILMGQHGSYDPKNLKCVY